MPLFLLRNKDSTNLKIENPRKGSKNRFLNRSKRREIISKGIRERDEQTKRNFSRLLEAQVSCVRAERVASEKSTKRCVECFSRTADNYRENAQRPFDD